MKKYKFKLRLLPVIIFTSVVFLLLKAHSYSIEINDMENIPINSSTELWDVFCYVKAKAILFITGWAVVNMAYLLITRQMKIKKTIIYIPMIIYSVFVLVSYLFSDFKSIAWVGGVELFEGSRIILCYMFMLFYTINVIDEIKDAYTVIISTLIGVFIASVIGLSQFLGCDLYLSKLGNFIITGSGDISLRGEFKPGDVYQSVENMNYVGMYLSLIVPILVFTLYYLVKNRKRQTLLSMGIDKNRYFKIMGCCSFLLLLIIPNIYGAGSVGGVLGIAFSLFVLVLVELKNKRVKIILISAFLIGATALLSIVYIRGADSKKNTGHKQIQFFETGIDYVKMSIDGEVLNIINDRENDTFKLEDDTGKYIGTFCFAGEEGQYQVEDRRFEGKLVIIPIKDIHGEQCIIINVKDDRCEAFCFTYHEDGAKYLNPFGEEVSLGKIRSIGFDGHLYAGSNRAYIWSRTLPLILDKWLTGYGVDTFMFVFPQGDYAGKYTCGMPVQLICDKPHNLYLGIAMGVGIIGLFAFLSILAIALYRAFSSENNNLLSKVIAAGISGFLFVGLFSDSSICIMPMFYGMLGIMIALIQKQEM